MESALQQYSRFSLILRTVLSEIPFVSDHSDSNVAPQQRIDVFYVIHFLR